MSKFVCKETPKRIYDRLKRESLRNPGRLERFLDVAARYIEELGIEPTDSNIRSRYPHVVATYNEFWPLRDEESLVLGASAIATEKFENKPLGDPFDDALWVASMMCVKDVKSKDAPSWSAWSLLHWVRADERNRTDFFKTIWTKLLPSQRDVDAMARQREKVDPLLALNEELDALACEEIA